MSQNIERACQIARDHELNAYLAMLDHHADTDDMVDGGDVDCGDTPCMCGYMRTALEKGRRDAHHGRPNRNPYPSSPVATALIRACWTAYNEGYNSSGGYSVVGREESEQLNLFGEAA